MKEEEYSWLGLRQIKMAKNVFFRKSLSDFVNNG